MKKDRALADITEAIESCRICRKDSLGQAVAGEGSSEAKIVFVGEAPGKTEAQTGRPFVGRSGKLLRQSIISLGLKEEEVFITSVVKYLPKQGTPTDKQITHGRTHLLAQLEIINPQIIVLLGRVAIVGVLGEALAISQVHGTTLKKDGKTYFFSYHPAAALRFTKFRESFVTDFKKIKKLL